MHQCGCYTGFIAMRRICRQDATQDFVIANHVLEHTLDPIRALETWMRVLDEQGILFMAIPNKLLNVDKYKPITTLDHFIDCHESDVKCGQEKLERTGKRGHFHYFNPDTTKRLMEYLDYDVVHFEENNNEIICILKKW